MSVGHGVDGVNCAIQCLVKIVDVHDGFRVNDALQDVAKDTIPSFDQANPPMGFRWYDFKKDAMSLHVVAEVEGKICHLGQPGWFVEIHRA